jgi:small subunit ribosomal protein S6
MAENQPRLYEGMFLIDQQQMAGDLNAALAQVQQVLDRREAELVSIRKWEERRLAYEINGQKRGTYILALFRAAPQTITQMERDVNLSDMIARVLFTRADHMGETEIQAEIDAAQGTQTEAKLREGEGEAPAETPEEQAEDESEPGPEEEPVASGENHT